MEDNDHVAEAIFLLVALLVEVACYGFVLGTNSAQGKVVDLCRAVGYDQVLVKDAEIYCVRLGDEPDTFNLVTAIERGLHE